MISKFPDLKQVSDFHADKLRNIQCCAFDIDGILTNGQIRFDGEEMGFNRSFHTSDGYGLKVLMQAGLHVGVISGGDSEGIRKRFVENLKLDFAFFGNEDKREAYLKLLERGFRDEEILYMGDEFFDLPLLKRAGFSATVPSASFEVRDQVDYVTFRDSGTGCAREVIDILRYAQGIIPKVPGFDEM